VPIVIVAAVATLIMSAIVIMLSELFSGRALRPVEPLDVESRTIEDRVEKEEQGVAAPIFAATAPVSAAKLAKPSMLTAAVDDDEEPEAEPVEDAPADENEFSVSSVASYLADCRAPLAVSISPTGDNGSAATVALARLLADDGRRVILIDMTGSGYPTELMAENTEAPGVTDLLCGEAAFGETIHGDRLSDAHLIPQGVSDVRRAMRGVDRLSLLLDALSSAYDIVIVECGAADVAGVSRLTRSKDIEIILSLPEIEEAAFVGLMQDFQGAGYERVVLMSGGEEAAMRSPERHAA